jgi:hypothetical protein
VLDVIEKLLDAGKKGVSENPLSPWGPKAAGRPWCRAFWEQRILPTPGPAVPFPKTLCNKFSAKREAAGVVVQLVLVRVP